MERRAGILLHPTSLPGRFGLGDIGPEAERFLEWLRDAGASLWQVLPLGPCGYGGSPYGCASAFAGNRYLVSPDGLAREGWLGEEDLEPDGDLRDAVEAVRCRDRVLERAWERFGNAAETEKHAAFDAFRADPAQAAWLDDWTLFTALKDEASGAPWTDWPESLRRRDPRALDAARQRLRQAIEREAFVQFLFFRQWAALRQRAAAAGVAIFGDMPIYVAGDGADVWAHRELFDLDEDGNAVAVSGVPPDYFSATGQRWGSPLYRWDACRAEGFAWWIERLRANLRLADLVRIDHFRGFAGFWAIPASEPTAVVGEWRPGPGRELFDATRAAIGALPFVAEDLGVITADVVALRDALGLPGMKVLQFGFGSDDSPHLPHRHVANAVVYTGTHDNDTARGWWEHASAAERSRARDYSGSDGRDFPWDLARLALASVAETAVVPMQDVLGLGSDARLNTPGKAEGNWGWQMAENAASPVLAARFRRLAALTGRIR
ncbi:MAG TPA: 4-alpha-glucanotransferase [Thermoanaerobaculia bacterium]|nr:4-alpha-glucanotransferase [Thermoanaerobaculia bacterium]